MTPSLALCAALGYGRSLPLVCAKGSLKQLQFIPLPVGFGAQCTSRVVHQKTTLIHAYKYVNRAIVKSVFLKRLKCEQIFTAFDLKINLGIEQNPRVVINGKVLQFAAVVLVKSADQISIFRLRTDDKPAFTNCESEFITLNLLNFPYGQFRYFPEIGFLHYSLVNKSTYELIESFIQRLN